MLKVKGKVKEEEDYRLILLLQVVIALVYLSLIESEKEPHLLILNFLSSMDSLMQVFLYHQDHNKRFFCRVLQTSYVLTSIQHSQLLIPISKTLF